MQENIIQFIITYGGELFKITSIEEGSHNKMVLGSQDRMYIHYGWSRKEKHSEKQNSISKHLRWSLLK